MRLADIPARLVEDAVRRWRRRVIAILIVAICALVALVEGLAALRLALESALDPVWAHLTLVGLFVGAMAVTVLVLGRLERRAAAVVRRGQQNKPPGKEERVSMIAEAIDLGYSLARDLKQADKRPSGTPSPGENNTPPDRRPAAG
jgi:hypothetical protein